VPQRSFHRSDIMNRHHALGALLAIIVSGVWSSAFADGARQRACSDSLVSGTYAGQLEGTQTLPDGTVAKVIGVVIRVYGGDGTVTQWDNVKNSATGYTPNRYGEGTYKVNDDCTVDTQFHPAPGVTIQERAVIVDDGRELRSITVLPAGLFVTSVQQRV
jgi:hypothetical protein